MYVTLNGTILESNQAHLSPMGAGFLYAYGLFETIKISGGKIRFLEEHITRLAAGCSQLGMDWTIDTALLKEQCLELIRTNELTDGSLKILYNKGLDTNNLLLSTNENLYSEKQYLRGMSLCLADGRRDSRNKLTSLKSCNYLENLLAREQAQLGGYDEAIFLNPSGMVCEGTFTNIFMVKDLTLYTPATECGLLPGIIRHKVLNLADGLGLDYQTGKYGIDSLLEADEVFLTNSLMDIMPASAFRQVRYNLQTNEITRYLQRKIRGTFYL